MDKILGEKRKKVHLLVRDTLFAANLHKVLIYNLSHLYKHFLQQNTHLYQVDNNKKKLNQNIIIVLKKKQKILQQVSSNQLRIRRKSTIKTYVK